MFIKYEVLLAYATLVSVVSWMLSLKLVGFDFIVVAPDVVCSGYFLIGLQFLLVSTLWTIFHNTSYLCSLLQRLLYTHLLLIQPSISVDVKISSVYNHSSIVMRHRIQILQTSLECISTNTSRQDFIALPFVFLCGIVHRGLCGFLDFLFGRAKIYFICNLIS